ncbi:hypothetical protein CI102_14546 [Trichoderma harzianum]|uniref:Uncharacterized protein n=1 Tax=Trichoderma harzianum CBS 226.95 TaxID=983964 RepID=A0A2T3ZRQ9_TRIHA|nr:hypothetical protein M431DRAFT_396743 [Trichoderma harzianum CBS 226.95]PKK42540.1 hypothetical protein CI102_14546 [Trichoderma harzianum]PTB47504.1 hypothetical protein M431DRAFT_396743 [Trichoderma harzianum CBS 226.95]
MVFPASPLFSFDIPREDVISAYSVWQRSQSRSSEQKAYYDLVEELTIAKGYTLDMIACNQERMCKFYEKHDIPHCLELCVQCSMVWETSWEGTERRVGCLLMQDIGSYPAL